MNGTIVDIETRFGVISLNSKSDNKMMRAFENGRYPNEELISLAGLFLGSGTVAVDIGAHAGTFAVPLGRRAHVIAFEPAPATYALLQRNADRALGSFDLRNKGLAATPGRAHVVGRNASNAGAHTLEAGGDIDVSTLDQEVERADFIKIDVEGMEEEVLTGGAGLIERSKPVVMFEVNLSQLRAHRSSSRALERFFKTHGYTLYLPLFDGGVRLASVGRLGLLTALIAPRAWLLHSDSAPFDIFAIPKEKELPVPRASFIFAMRWAVSNNIYDKIRRLRAFVRQ